MTEIKRRVSTRSLRKGALIEETYAICRVWDGNKVTSEFENMRAGNALSASNRAWLREVMATFAERFPDTERRAAGGPRTIRHGVGPLAFVPALSTGRTGCVVLYFAVDWLFPTTRMAYLGTKDVLPFVLERLEPLVAAGRTISTTAFCGRDLLRMATAFELLSKGTTRQFQPYQLSDEWLLYRLHALAETRTQCAAHGGGAGMAALPDGAGRSRTGACCACTSSNGSTIRPRAPSWSSSCPIRRVLPMPKASPMPSWKERLTQGLEPVLLLNDPRPKLSAYHDMPFAIFHYPPQVEFALRAELALLKTRLEQQGKRVTVVSLAECLGSAIDAVMPVEVLVEAEQAVGLEATIATLHQILSEYQPLAEFVVRRIANRCHTATTTSSSWCGPALCSRSTARHRSWNN